MAATTTAKQTTYRLFKVAAELNIGKETIVEFLKSKGFDIPVKPTSALTQEMHDLVMDKFEKEHRQIEKQRKKVDAYHERRSKTKDEPEPDAPKKGRSKTADDGADEPEIPVTEQPAVIEAAEEQVEVVLTPAVETPVDVITQQPVDESDVPQHVAAVDETPERVADVQEAEIAEAIQEAEEYEERSTPIETVEQAIEAAPPAIPEPEPEPIVADEPAEQQPVARRERETAEREPIEQQPVAAETAAVEQPAAEQPEAAEQTVGGGAEPAGNGEATQENDPAKPSFRAVPPKLQGLTVLGKIELASKAPPKEKEARRKRKRIREAVKSVDIKQEGNRPAPVVVRPASQSTTGGPPRPGQGTTAAGQGGDKGKKKIRGRGGSVSVDQTEVSKAIRQTFSNMGESGGSARQKRSRAKRDIREERAMRRMEREQAEASVLTVTEYVTVAELANMMNVDVGQVISTCISLGLMVSINQRLDKDTIQLVADEFGFSIEFQQDYAEDVLADTEDEPETLKPRAPIVTIMGHVDHGKTSLLDYIRSANVVAGEAGGITQHIGAYSVKMGDGRKITFLDTPGHEAFTAMRARGAQITDIVILVVAADDAVMPQTIEAISHAQAAGVPMVVAINKVDKPEANPEKIKQQLSERGVLVEAWGGKYQAIEISAKKGDGVDKLLEAVLLEAEILTLKANPDRTARGVIIEAEIDKGKGIIATALIQKGTLKIGDNFVAGQYAGRVRALLDERGNRIEQAGPSEPAQVLGLGGVPTAGDVLVGLENEQDAKEIALRRQQLRREQEFKQVRHITLDEISEQISRGGVQHLPLIIKGDVDGSVEALADSLLRQSTPEVQVTVVMKSVGEISESDVLLASASRAIIIGFHVRPNLKARKLAEREGVEIRTYQIIYDTVNDIRAALEGMLRPEQKEIITGTVEVRDIFKVSKIGIIAGCYVLDGKITRNDRVRLLRDGLEVYTGSISSLRRLKEDVREVEQGFECGLTLENMNDIKLGDVVEAYKMVEVKRKLEAASGSNY